MATPTSSKTSTPEPRPKTLPPTAMQELADANRALKAQAAELRTELAEERSRTKVMHRIIAELSLEPENAKSQLTAAASVARLPFRTGPSETVRRD